MEMFAANVPELQLRIVAIYRRPNRHITSESLSQIRKQLSKPGRSIVVGDLNLDSRLARPEPQKLWCELLEAGLSQRVRIITHPPRHAGEKASTIDHFWVPKEDKVECTANPGGMFDGASDHNAIEASIQAPKPKKVRTAYWTRAWDRVKAADISTVLARNGIRKEVAEAGKGVNRQGDRVHPTEDSQPIANPRPLPQLLALWNKARDAVKAELAPNRFVVKRTKPGTARLSKRAKSAVQERGRARRKHTRNLQAEEYDRDKAFESAERLREARKAAKRAIRESNASIIEQDRQRAGGDMQQVWNLRSKLAGGIRKAPPQPAATPQEANRYFVDKPQRVQRATLHAPLAEVSECTGSEQGNFETVTPRDVLKAIKK